MSHAGKIQVTVKVGAGGALDVQLSPAPVVLADAVELLRSQLYQTLDSFCGTHADSALLYSITAAIRSRLHQWEEAGLLVDRTLRLSSGGKYVELFDAPQPPPQEPPKSKKNALKDLLELVYGQEAALAATTLGPEYGPDVTKMAHKGTKFAKMKKESAPPALPTPVPEEPKQVAAPPGDFTRKLLLDD